MVVELVCVVAGGLFGCGLTAYVFQQKRWPVMIQHVKFEVEQKVKQDILQQTTATVQPVVDHVVSQIQEVVNIVEEAVLELIVRFQEITDAATQEANQTAAELGNGSDGESQDGSLLDETN